MQRLLHLLLLLPPLLPTAPPAASSAAAKTAKIGAHGFSFGSWWARLPLKLTSDATTSAGDLNGTLATLRATNQTLVGFSAEVCGSSSVPGDRGTGGVGLGDLEDFLDAAALAYPELRVFAAYSSHHPLANYCPRYLNGAFPSSTPHPTPTHSARYRCLPQTPRAMSTGPGSARSSPPARAAART